VQAMLPRGFLFHQFNYKTQIYLQENLLPEQKLFDSHDQAYDFSIKSKAEFNKSSEEIALRSRNSKHQISQRKMRTTSTSTCISRCK